MRRSVMGSLVAGLALAASATLAGTASAQQATWTITPGGDFDGLAGETILTIQETGIQLFCSSSTAGGTAKSGSGQTNPLATIPETGGIDFIDCQGPFGLTFEVEQVGDWTLNGSGYDAGTGVTTGTIDGITANIVGPSCNATVTGFVDATYTNGSAELAVTPNPTLDISYVDPNNTCLGLISEGQHATFDGTYEIDPALTVTSP
ncbi:hypothetical protein [Actinophytocola gossypii]|uniref:Secreted protein n=1 Tax=Actinophytocola gossypii TaxID=2812003 RepID=A0ABT2JDY3_9PSEU|nr:hypothetical protein [Actinophytocola gossypii]MCT2586077.1 hypothetical protein [Actinophytocola gossypii]